MRHSIALLALSALTPALAFAQPRPEPAAPGSNWFIAMDPLVLKTTPETGGRVRLSFDDVDTPEVDLSLLGANRIESDAFASRITFGWRWNHVTGLSGGLQARFFDVKDATSQRARRAPGTVELPNFGTYGEVSDFEAFTGDVEATLAYSMFGFTLEGTLGKRSARFLSSGKIDAFGVFTTGNFVNMQLSNGSAFEGQGNLQGFTIAYRAPQWPVSVFLGRRVATLEGESDSFGRAVGTVASSPSAPLVGAATVTRNNATATELEIGETRYGVQADFGATGARFRPFSRLVYEKMSWQLDGPPTGGAGFGGTIGDLTTSSFASAGLGRANLEGWSLAVGMAF